MGREFQRSNLVLRMQCVRATPLLEAISLAESREELFHEHTLKCSAKSLTQEARQQVHQAHVPETPQGGCEEPRQSLCLQRIYYTNPTYSLCLFSKLTPHLASSLRLTSTRIFEIYFLLLACCIFNV